MAPDSEALSHHVHPYEFANTSSDFDDVDTGKSEQPLPSKPDREWDGVKVDEVDVPDRRGWRKLMAYVGPGFLVSIAYIDPGNFESDLQAGARYQYQLLWVILLASCFALIIQSLAANLGVVSGKHLSEHCRSEYPRNINLGLWLLAELAIVASDIPEVIGSAYALNMLFGIPVWAGVLLTGFSTLMLLALQQYGVRKLELLIAFLVFTMAACFFVELGYASPPLGDMLTGLIVPKLDGSGATGLAISLLGAMVMPHNLFLHSALVLTRKIPRNTSSIKDACRYYLVESGFALFLSFLINVCVISVSGAVCSSKDLSEENRDSCSNLDLNRASFLLRNVLGRWSFQLFAIALLASGQSSTITGTYAGQYVMQGFLNLQFQPWLRNLLTRSVAIVPSLIVALIGGSAGAGKLIIISSMILSFELPFALIPLLKFTSSTTKMGPYANSLTVTSVTWVIGFCVMLINIYFVSSALWDWILHSSFSIVSLILLGSSGVLGILVYLGAIIYLAIRQDKEVTYLLSEGEMEIDGVDMIDAEASRNSGDLELHGLLSFDPKDSAQLQQPQDGQRQ
ncbi:natural resistance-associated macrophage protein 2 [Marchantia polymorpha subsp. ruderalis]|uniref:Uncharacterized protein n=2 Tax=Marchantia polymorpha TaxID=3197 RepID=A0A176VNY8_MARPO|nr:hypothetical protein AXG93_531s1120 [Marchantia polymorpha subsp. ruderalis]PTQ49238.1 hypothetical protein MARPO_0003s0129 [Marchantia polymorpha]BBN17001.1 hypothetical protein Mp_7g11150 [Marchantia polymorpha subsp. ruderalis]|eukprot:PTQ49238.1 hypothetical protein MARPO_0003s0129 [Marchantia polymorpha]